LTFSDNRLYYIHNNSMESNMKVFVVIGGWNNTSANEMWVFSSKKVAEKHADLSRLGFDWMEVIERVVNPEL
jgi:transposase